jgi:hypothetical protein
MIMDYSITLARLIVWGFQAESKDFYFFAIIFKLFAKLQILCFDFLQLAFQFYRIDFDWCS